ncbi:hypothetical protein, conserved [Eimeria tenella]|uniref:Uncharacterized protein n=1 Tax=Eimeria tenella TaxID=5802 RepID=U6KWY9_EIMTE|nr:hypothetical protein, conserved [Eimeria tenella]CDJ42466.1 hypothetical protein, conserved [Eimeria tenella]|eukprot:XP_013233216.1 hypothetical protein, conserved [Eimeria tenella]
MLHRALQELADDWEMSSPHFGHCKALFGVLQVFAKQSTEEFFKHCTSLGNPGRRDWLNSQVSAETNLDLAFGILSAYASAFDKEPPQEEPTSTLVDACVFFILRVKSTNAELEEALQDFVSSGTEDSRFLLAERLRDARVWVQEARGMLASPGMGRNSVSVTKLREAVSALGDKCSAASTALGAALQRRS